MTFKKGETGNLAGKTRGILNARSLNARGVATPLPCRRVCVLTASASPHTENPSKWERGKPAQINAAQ
jgi:hypothetical protein